MVHFQGLCWWACRSKAQFSPHGRNVANKWHILPVSLGYLQEMLRKSSHLHLPLHPVWRCGENLISVTPRKCQMTSLYWQNSTIIYWTAERFSKKNILCFTEERKFYNARVNERIFLSVRSTKQVYNRVPWYDILLHALGYDVNILHSSDNITVSWYWCRTFS